MKKTIFKMAVLLIACLFVFASCKDTVEAVQFTDEIASVNGEVYSSLQEAIDNANENDIVKLLCDVVGSGFQINESIILDFDGHTYTFKEGEVGYQEAKLSGGDGAICIGNESIVTLQNAVLVANKGFTQSLVGSAGTLTIKDTKLSANEGYTEPLINSCGSLKVQKSTVTPLDGCQAFFIEEGTAEFDAETKITGVINVGHNNVEAVKFETTPTDVFFTGGIADKIVVNGTTASDFKASVAKIGSTGYETLKQAVTSATNGDTIMLLADITDNESAGTVHYTSLSASNPDSALLIDKSLTIDGLNYTFETTLTHAFSITSSNTDLVLKNITVYAKTSAVYIGENVGTTKLTVDNSLLHVSSGYTIRSGNGSNHLTITVNNSTVEGYSAFTLRCNNSIINVKDSDLLGENDSSEHSSNNYATIVLDGADYSETSYTSYSPYDGKPGVCGSDNTVNIINSKVTGTTINANTQVWLNLQYGTRRNTITVDALSILSPNSTWHYTEEDGKTTNTVTVNGVVKQGTLGN